MTSLPVLISIFTFAQLMPDVEQLNAYDPTKAAAATKLNLKVSHLSVFWDILCRPFILLWCTFIGIVIGVLPAIGGSAANIMAYDQAKKFSKRPEKFGTGVPEGIMASEASNSANVAGSLMMIMAFGIPGDAVTAVMMGADDPWHPAGPLFISQQPRSPTDLCRLLIGAAADGRGDLGRLAGVDAHHHDAEVDADPDRPGAVRNRRLRAQRRHEGRLRARALLRHRLRDGEGAASRWPR